MEDRRTRQAGSEVWSHGTKSGRFSGSVAGWRVPELSTEKWQSQDGGGRGRGRPGCGVSCSVCGGPSGDHPRLLPE